MTDRLLHDTCRFHNLRQKHFALAKQITDDIHSVHQRTLDDLNRATAPIRDLLTNLLSVFDNEIRQAVNHRMRESFLNRLLAPGKIFLAFDTTALDTISKGHQAFGRRSCVISLFASKRLRTIQYHVLDQVAQYGINLGIYAQLSGIDDAHRHAFANRVIQKYRMNSLSHRLIATKRKAHIRDTT